jgi:hypothetical protein
MRLSKVLTAMAVVAGLFVGTVGLAGSASADRGDGVRVVEIADATDDTTVRDIQAQVERETGTPSAAKRTVVVEADKGSRFTNDEYAALGEGRPAGSAKVLGTIEQPASDATVGEMARQCTDDGSRRGGVIVIVIWGDDWIIIIVIVWR